LTPANPPGETLTELIADALVAGDHMTDNSARRDLADLLSVEPPDITTVLQQLSDLQDILLRLAPEDGGAQHHDHDRNNENPVANFNRLYHTITSKIVDGLHAGDFEDPVFLELLDVEFAKRYLHALRLWCANSPHTPESWQVLFHKLHDQEVRPLPAASAGVNAHINYDLPFALISTWQQLGSNPDNEAQHRDYLLINEVFFAAIPALRRSYLTTWQLTIDRLNGKLDDWYQNLLVEFTRDLAWQSAHRIWPMRDNLESMRHAQSSLDGNAALIGRALLAPISNLLQ
jgi:hypothetical protein